MAFLPKDYAAPEAQSSYTRLEEGDNTFRVLDSAIVGWEWWNEKDGKRIPNRVKNQNDLSEDDLSEIYNLEAKTKRTQLKHFWAFPVYNYKIKYIQILQITQGSIQVAMERYTKNEKWGDPKEYDFIINRSGEGMQTRYSTTVNPKESLDEDIIKKYKEMNINLKALYSGDDPFARVTESLDVDEVAKAME